jgi:Rha family phage regulatory protein
MELATLTTLEGMDSRDIAALTGKRHDNVLRDIKAMLVEMEVGELKFEGSYLTEQNKEARCYILPKRECLILASGYSVKLRAAIIDRWAELEKAKAPMTRLEFARALLEAEERAEEVEREKKLLLVELDKSKEYASIKRMEKLTGKKFSWRRLKAQAHEMGVESKEVFDQNYGTVKAYRADVWMEAYGIALIPE